MLLWFLYDDDRSMENLLHWASQDQLALVGNFFWNSGSAGHKSQVGLLRSLSCDILQQHRKLISIVLPQLWAEKCLDSDNAPTVDAWSLQNLADAFLVLATQKLRSRKFRLIVDGLGECEEGKNSHWDIIQKFETLAAS
jgi:hypothetical protein